MKHRQPGATRPRPIRHIESEHGRCLIRWRDYNKVSRPDLRWLYHVPNGVAVSAAQAGMAKAEGLTKGVWDYHLPVRRGNCPGLVIELKKPEYRTRKNGGLSDEQVDFGAHMRQQGWQTAIAYHWQEAVAAIERYLEFGYAEDMLHVVDLTNQERTTKRAKGAS